VTSSAPLTLDCRTGVTALLIIAFSIVAGLIGSLLGLGGGLIIIPALTLALGFNMQEAVGASLIGVIATSTGAASRYVQQGFVNVKLGMLLETTTTIGSIIGALIAIYTDQKILALVFAVILTYSAIYMMRRPERTISPDSAELDGQMLNALDLHRAVRQRRGENLRVRAWVPFWRPRPANATAPRWQRRPAGPR